MARIIHRCVKCGHPQDEHRGKDCSLGWCPCNLGTAEFGPSVLAPTWADSKPVETITPPGHAWNGGIPALVGCNCPGCVELHQGLG